MGVFVRDDSPFYWLRLERPNGPALREPTKIPKNAYSAEVQKANRQAAQDVYAVRMAELAKSGHALPAKIETIAFDDYATWFEKHVLAKMRGADRERATLKHLRAFFKASDLKTITRARAREYVTHRLGHVVPRTTRHVSANTVNREVALLKAMLREAVPTYLSASPLAGMPLERVVKKPKRILSPAEETRLLEQLDPRDRALYIVAVDTLIRLSNVISLRRDENKGTHLELHDSKTGPYTVPLSTRARKALAALKGKTAYYFPHRRVAKNPRDWRGAIRLMLQRACARCHPPIPYGRAVKGITFHTSTRATGATRMLRAGIDLRTLMEVGNWKDVRAAQEYLTSDQALKRRAVNQIGRGVRVT